MKTAPSPCRRCSARLALHVERPDHQGSASHIMGSGRIRIMHAPKKAAVPSITDRPPLRVAWRPVSKRKRQADFPRRRKQPLSTAAFILFPGKMIIIKNFTIPSRCRRQNTGPFSSRRVVRRPALKGRALPTATQRR